MANLTTDIPISTVGAAPGPVNIHVPVKGATTIYKGGLVAQHSGGYYVPLTTSGGGCAVGVAQATVANTGADGAKRLHIETERVFVLKNGTAGDAFSDTSKLGSPVYATDDNTVADNSATGTRPCVGSFCGFEADGRVRVFVSMHYAYLVQAINALQTLTDAPATADALRDNIVSAMSGLL